MTATTPYDDIDTILGPGEARFFANGFRKVGHGFDPIRLRALDGLPTADTLVKLTYPADWSAKPGLELRPHLSTIDAYVIAVQLADLILDRSGVSPASRTGSFITSVRFDAGSTPQDVDLQVACQATLSAAPTHRDPTSAWEWPFACAIGSIRIDLTLTCPEPPNPATPAEQLNIDDALGPAENRFYASGYRDRVHHINHPIITDHSSITALIGIDTPPGQNEWSDIEGALTGNVTILDCLLAQSQMSQALLYSLDGLTRNQANTMWMRHVRIAATQPNRPYREPFAATAAVTGSRIVPLNGLQWRTATFQGNFHDITSTYKLASQLPTT